MVIKSSFALPVIYVMRINDKAHEGALKIGMTSYKDALPLRGDSAPPEPNSAALNEAAHKCILKYTQRAGITYELLYTQAAIARHDGKVYSFIDKTVHAVFRRSGIKQRKLGKKHKSTEWFECDLETAKRAIMATAEGRRALLPQEITQKQSPVEFRPEQQEAIDMTVKRFRKRGAKMLWNAKMRFGKTISALQVVKKCGFSCTLILTHRPVVNAGWFGDFGKVFYDSPQYKYSSKSRGEDLHNILKKSGWFNKNKVVYFASMQDLRGSAAVGGEYDKNSEIFDAQWDCVIIDEGHEGTQTQLGQKVLEAVKKKHTCTLALSGTPFNLLEKYDDSECYTWDYIMEQKAKAEWDKTHFGDSNPYAGLPRMNIFTYDLCEAGLERYKMEEGGEAAFNFREFFCTEGGQFKHKEDVASFLNLLCTGGDGSIHRPYGAALTNRDSLYPFATEEYRENFRHTLWMVPGVSAARELCKMLREHDVFGQFKIVNVAGEGDEVVRYAADGGYSPTSENTNSLEAVLGAIGEAAEDTRTITVSCGRLTTGVSVPAWTAVLMLSGTYMTSAASYMQTIFRVQTPATIGGRVKTECYVFDFAPDRALRVAAETARFAVKGEGRDAGGDRKRLSEFLNFCPVIAVKGSAMKPYSTEHLLETLKRVYVERVVQNGFCDACLYNRELLNITDGDLKQFEKLKGILKDTRALGTLDKIVINDEGLTDEKHGVDDGGEDSGGGKAQAENREKTAEEKRLALAKKRRQDAIKILRYISVRLPLMMYGADLTDEDQEITAANFATLIDDASWAEFMPNGVTKEVFASFTRYYDEDIFRAAARRVRALARQADSMTVEERIARIAAIFQSFHSTDKETVLTPWRVVNMHLSKALGGYSFFAEDDKTMLSSPRLAEGAAKDAFTPVSRILEINSKTALYPLYCAYSVYRARLSAMGGEGDGKAAFCNNEVWRRTLAENIFVLCKTPMAVSIARRTLAGWTGADVNVQYIEDMARRAADEVQRGELARNIRAWAKKTVASDKWQVASEEEEEMHFDVVVGNPPYQELNEGNGNGADPVYHQFMSLSFHLAPIASLITPGRFLFNAGKTPKDWNEKMLSDKHIKVVQYFANSMDVFPPPVNIMGGVVITLRDERQDFGGIGGFTAFEELNSILRKVLGAGDFVSIQSIIYVQNKFDLKRLYDDHPEYNSIIGSGGKEKRFRTHSFELLPDVFTIEQQGKDMVKVLGLLDNDRTHRYILTKYIAPHPNFDKWKVLVPAGNGSGALGEVLSTPLVGKPMVVEPLVGYTESFIGFGAFGTQAEAEACLTYIKTKFARTMLGTLKVTQHNNRDTWANVPLPDFSPASLIDWTQGAAEVDKQLYSKYGLTAEEREFIETHVKEM